MKKLVTSIVETSLGKFYLMNHSDDRFNTDNYKEVSVSVEIENSVSDFNNRKCKLITLKNGDKFEVFSDWSARKLKS